MKRHLSKIVFPVLALGLPLSAFAIDAKRLIDNFNGSSTSVVSGGCPSSVKKLSDLIGLTLCTLQSLMPILFVAALLYFLWGAISFIRADDKTRDEARTKITFGLIGLFVMVSVWGLVAVLSGTFGFDTNVPTVPVLPGFPR